MRRSGAPGHASEADPDQPTLPQVAARALPKRGKGGSLKSRQCILHSLVHIENIAVDLAWDAIARFGRAEGLPRAFFDDFATVAEDEVGAAGGPISAFQTD